jgi:Tfp pilus assembly protein PilX
MSHSSERGIAMVLALFMVLVLSVLGSSLMFVSQTETWSSLNYRLTSQARYGAESGLHRAANYMLYTYPAPGTVADPLAAYNMNTSPVTLVANGRPVVLSSDPARPSNYPVAATVTAFNAATTGTLDVSSGVVAYDSIATLRSMRQIVDSYSGNPVTLQTWEITSAGDIGGPRSSKVEVTATIERQVTPVYQYAAFASFNGCAALSFAGGATTNSYNSQAPLVGGVPVTSNTGGHVGTNGNLTEVGNTTTIHGSLSTPRSGVGNCTSNNVTAQTISGGATVSGGLTQLSQPITYPTPAAPNPLPGTGATSFGRNTGCPVGVVPCVPSANGATITPIGNVPVMMENVSVGSQAVIRLNAGTYHINSFTMNANAQIIIDSGPVIFKIAGQGLDNGDVISITGNGVSNASFNPSNLQFVYGGTGNVKMAGGADTAALLYAPNATGSFSGGSDFYGAVIVKQLTATGGASIHYDTNLQNTAMTAGNPMMSSFSWKSY